MDSDDDGSTYNIVRGRGGSSLYQIRHHLYHKDRQRGNKIYARCHLWKAGCMGRAVISATNNTVTSESEHNGNHRLGTSQAEVAEFRALLKSYSEESSNGLLREVYNRAASEMPAAASHLSFVQVKKSANFAHYSILTLSFSL